MILEIGIRVFYEIFQHLFLSARNRSYSVFTSFRQEINYSIHEKTISIGINIEIRLTKLKLKIKTKL